MVCLAWGRWQERCYRGRVSGRTQGPDGQGSRVGAPLPRESTQWVDGRLRPQRDLGRQLALDGGCHSPADVPALPGLLPFWRRLCALGNCYGKKPGRTYWRIDSFRQGSLSSWPFRAGQNQGWLSPHEQGAGVILALWCSMSGTHLGLFKFQCSCVRNGENSQGPAGWTRGPMSALEHGSPTDLTIAAAPASLGHPPPQSQLVPRDGTGKGSCCFWDSVGPPGLAWESVAQWGVVLAVSPRSPVTNTLPSFHTWSRCLDLASVSPCS